MNVFTLLFPDALNDAFIITKALDHKSISVSMFTL